ncbi:MAG TPA: ROK family protein [Acidimicrobiia bacterium]|nr:ROK family protein [Acidimicrobiia bacterium]
MNRIGIDVGGTKIEGVILTDAGAERGRLRVATPQGDYEATVDRISGLVDQLEAAHGRTPGAIGIGTPGAIDPSTGLLKNSNSVALNGRPFDLDLEKALGRPVILRNDADCFALSEARDGAAAGAAVVFGVIIGTGVGGGVVVGGRALSGPNAIAGEWGHNPLPWPRDDERPGPECYCGLTGCIETFLSGPGFAAPSGARAATDVISAARQGDSAAAAQLDLYCDRLARSLATIINVLDPDAIVLGGGMSNTDEIYQRVPDLWARYAFTPTVATRLLKNRHGDSSGVRGAAWLVG